MLGRRGDTVGRAEVVALEAARLCRGDLRCDPRILPRTLGNAPPTGVARHVEHGRESHCNAVHRGLLRGRARSSLPEYGIEQTRFRQRNRKNRAMAVDDVETQQQGNAEARFINGKALYGPHFACAPKVQQGADTSGADTLSHVVQRARAGDHLRRCDHIELADLFLDRHRRQQRIDASHAFASSKAERVFSVRQSGKNTMLGVPVVAVAGRDRGATSKAPIRT